MLRFEGCHKIHYVKQQNPNRPGAIYLSTEATLRPEIRALLVKVSDDPAHIKELTNVVLIRGKAKAIEMGYLSTELRACFTDAVQIISNIDLAFTALERNNNQGKLKYDEDLPF